VLIAVGRVKGQEGRFSVITADNGLNWIGGMHFFASEDELRAGLAKIGMVHQEIERRVSFAKEQPAV